MLGTIYALVMPWRTPTLWQCTSTEDGLICGFPQGFLELSVMYTMSSGDLRRVGPVRFNQGSHIYLCDQLVVRNPVPDDWLKVPEHLYVRTYPGNEAWTYAVDWKRDEPKVCAWMDEQVEELQKTWPQK